MDYIYLILHIIEYSIFIYLGLSALYILIFAFAGKLLPYRKTVLKKPAKLRKYAVLIPGYKEDNVICEVAMESLKQDYPKDFFDVVIIADSFLPETIEKLKLLPIKLIEVVFDKSTKSKALNKAMEILGDNYDVALILDADNIMEKDYISKINTAFDNGFQIVQCNRIAKNSNTSCTAIQIIHSFLSC